jgi:hypothetical protein
MVKRASIFAILACIFITANACAEPPADNGESFLYGFVVGDYVLVGQYPDSSVAYSGVARIEKIKDKLILTRQIGSQTIKADGVVEVPKPPGEGEIIRFRWRDKDPVVMTCLVNSDLDNYARLTCYVAVEGRNHTRPGIEALFPTAVWPSDELDKEPHPDGKT